MLPWENTTLLALRIIVMSLIFRAVGAKSYCFWVLSVSMMTSRQLEEHKCTVVHCHASKLHVSAINPLSKKDALPLFQEIETKDVMPAIKTDLDKLKTDFKGMYDPFALCK